MRRLLILAACLVATAVIAWLQEQTPRPLAADAPAATFSAGRAMADVRIVARAPHPVGSAANLAVRDHLVARMKDLGLGPQVRRMDAVTYQRRDGQDQVYAARVENILGVLPGLDRRAPAVMVMAHYDSVPGSPGAADDAAGVAAGLEIMRALKARGLQRRDVILLITDGEESGLLGAGGFFNSDPLAKRVGFVLNMEARGGGGRAQMFQTGPGGGQTIALLQRTATRPSASSLAAYLYQAMPNDTDFTRSRAAGIAGLNYAFIGRQFDYHSAASTPDNLDQGALQDIGRQVLAVAAGAAAAPELPRESADMVYSHVFGDLLAAYPPVAGWALLALVAVFLLVGAARARRAGALDWLDIGRGVGVAAYLVATAAAALRFARRATGVEFGFLEQRALLAQADRFEAAVVLVGLGVLLAAAALAGRGGRLLAAGLALVLGAGCLAAGGDTVGLALGGGAAILAFLVFGRAAGAAGVWTGLLATGLVAAVALQALAPAAAVAIAWPLTLAALASAVSASGVAAGLLPRLATPLVAIIGLGWLGGYIHGVYLGLDMPELLALFAWLAALLVWPLAHPRPQDETKAPGAALLALAAGFALVAWIRLAEPWTPRFPQTTMVAYRLDMDARRAWRVSLTPAEQSAWTRSVLTADGGAIGRGHLRPLYRRPFDAAPARWVPAEGPVLELHPEPDGRMVFRAMPAPGARLMVLDLMTRADVIDPMLNGRPARLLTRPGRWTRIRWEAAPEGFEISFKAGSPGALEVRYAAVVEAWPTAATALPPRPATTMGFDLSDSTVITGSRRLAW